MLTQQNLKTVTDVRQNFLDILKYTKKSQNPVFILQHSKPAGVFLDFEKYQQLMEMVKDHIDLITAESEFENKKSKYLPLNKFWKQNNLTEE